MSWQIEMRQHDGLLTRAVEGEINGKAADMLAKLIDSDEPFFILRAKDIFSVMAVARYLNIVSEYGPMDPAMEQGIVEAMNDMKDWQRNHPSKVRYPD